MNGDVSHTAETCAAETPVTSAGARVYRPLTDIVETDEGVTLMLEVPGVSANGLDVTLEKRVLTIRGKVHYTRRDKLQLAYAEYREGDHERVFTRPDDFDPTRSRPNPPMGVDAHAATRCGSPARADRREMRVTTRGWTA